MAVVVYTKSLYNQVTHLPLKLTIILAVGRGIVDAVE